MNELDAVNLGFKARVVLIGRTGLDDVARKLRGSEVVRVRTPVEAIAEVAIPSDADAPRRVVVVVGTDSALSIEEFGENGDGAAEFLRGLHSIHPRARLLRAVTRRNMNDPVTGGYHGSVPLDATPIEFVAAFTAASRMILNGHAAATAERQAGVADSVDSAAAIESEELQLREDVVQTVAVSQEDPDTFFAGMRELAEHAPQCEDQDFEISPRISEQPEISEAVVEPENPKPESPALRSGFDDFASYPSTMAAPGVFINGFTSVAVPIQNLELPSEYIPAPMPEPEPVNAASSASASVSASALPSLAALQSPGATASDRMLQAVLAGSDPRITAIEIIREAVGDPSVMLTDLGDALPGVVVAFDGRPLAKLRARVAPEALAPHAVWLGQWLRLDEHLGELRDWAFTDALTGAWNRRYFEMFLAESIEEARKLRRSLSVLFFDIDNFKNWNDENGHAAGDEILVETVKLLKSVIRPTDKVCRVGGDEFAVIFHEPQGPRDPGSRHPDDLFQIAKRFQAQIRNKRFPKLSATHTPLGISGGLATYPWDARSAEELIKVADQRSMQCKRQGKNAIIFGDEGTR